MQPPRLASLAIGITLWLGLVTAAVAAPAEPEVLSATAEMPMHMAVQDGQLYVHNANSKLERVTLADGSRETVIERGVHNFAIDADAVYYATDSELWRQALDGGEPVLLGRTATSVPVQIVLDDQYVYFVVYDRSGVYRVDKLGGSIETVLAKRAVDLVAVDASHVYIGSWSAGWVGRMAKRGRDRRLEVLARKQRPVGLVVDDDRIYWTAEVDMSVRAIAKPGRKRVKRLPRVKTLATGLGADVLTLHGEHVYWQGFAGEGVRSIARVRRGGGATEVLADALPYPGSIAVDDERVYVGVQGKVVTLPLP